MKNKNSKKKDKNKKSNYKKSDLSLDFLGEIVKNLKKDYRGYK